MTQQTRRRGEELEYALLEAAWDQLVEGQVDEFTFANVAARAHTSKPVLYRRWANRTELFIAAVSHHRQRFAIDRPNTGSLRGDVIEILRQLNERQSEAVIMLAKFSIGASWLDVDSHELYTRTALSERPSIAVAVDNARQRGEITCELPERLMRMPGELGWAAIIRDMRPLEDENITAVVDELFLPLVHYYEEISPS